MFGCSHVPFQSLKRQALEQQLRRGGGEGVISCVYTVYALIYSAMALTCECHVRIEVCSRTLYSLHTHICFSAEDVKASGVDPNGHVQL